MNDTGLVCKKTNLKGGLPFDPTEFDVDGFIESDKLAKLALENGAMVTSGPIKVGTSGIRALIDIERKARAEIAKITGMKFNADGTADFYLVIRTSKDTKKLFEPNDLKDKEVQVEITNNKD
jgi:hypothetical protein